MPANPRRGASCCAAAATALRRRVLRGDAVAPGVAPVPPVVVALRAVEFATRIDADGLLPVRRTGGLAFGALLFVRFKLQSKRQSLDTTSVSARHQL
jgi:hypothetical protein